MGGWWDDFSNNLATDLSPFVALFGDTPTKQYLSECLSLVDAIILAIAPLGVITAAVSAIRVTGPPSLRAFIGRAQEGAGTAEAELCSSTSRDVCELYTNGGGIARVLGRPKLLEIVHEQHVSRHGFIRYGLEPATAGIQTFEDYMLCPDDWVEESRRETQIESGARISRPEAGRRGHQPRKQRLDFAPNPNLTLNIGIRHHPTWVLITTAVAGVFLQLGVLTWAGIARYNLGWTRGDFQDRYGVLVLVMGTTLLSTGIIQCAALVEGSTKERVFTRPSSSTAASRLYWVQPGTQFIGDQAFDSFAYSHPRNQFNRYITSWKDAGVAPKTLSLGVALGLTVVGFALQFLGLRACHSTVAIAQLALTLLMSIVRSWLRSNRLSDRDVCLSDWPELYAGHELDWLALYIGHIDPPRCRREWKISESRSYQHGEFGTTKLEATPFIHTYLGNEKTVVLSGFQRDRGAAAQGAGWRLQWSAPETWRFRDHLLTGEHRDRPAMEETGATFLYRARLAQLTTDWDDQLVQVRPAARSVARAIEATANLLFAADDIVLEDGWDSPFFIFWAVPCETTTTSMACQDQTNKSVCPSSHITADGQPGKPLYLSLRRPLDRDREVCGEWSADTSELEAMLGLWAWSVRDSRKHISHLEVYRRIVWIGASDQDIREFQSWGGGRQDRVGSRESLLGNPTVFGWHHVPAETESNTKITSILIDDRPWPILCAQELFSIFFASILHMVRDLGGETTKAGKSEITNTTITRIQRAFTGNGLGSVNDAMTCIFPALKIQDKLPQVQREADSGSQTSHCRLEKMHSQNFRDINRRTSPAWAHP